MRMHPLEIPSGREFGPSCPYHSAFFKVDEDIKTTKRRVAAVSKACYFPVKAPPTRNLGDEDEDELRRVLKGKWADQDDVDDYDSDATIVSASSDGQEEKVDLYKPAGYIAGPISPRAPCSRFSRRRSRRQTTPAPYSMYSEAKRTNSRLLPKSSDGYPPYFWSSWCRENYGSR
jgi:hypothetical protein